MAAPKTKPAPAKRQQEFDNTNRGVLFLNGEKTKDTSPDFTGKLLIDPNDYEADDQGKITLRLAAWNQNSPKVGDYLSIVASQPKQE